jgi:hypothetical protein
VIDTCLNFRENGDVSLLVDINNLDSDQKVWDVDFLSGELCHTCVVCLESPSSFAFVTCGHHSLCEQCATLYLTRRISSCTICRGESSFIMKVNY